MIEKNLSFFKLASAQEYMYVGIHTPTSQHVHAKVHTCIHTHMHTHMHTYIPGTSLSTQFQHLQARLIHTYIHTCIHTYTHAYIHTWNIFISSLLSFSIFKLASASDHVTSAIIIARRAHTVRSVRSSCECCRPWT